MSDGMVAQQDADTQDLIRTSSSVEHILPAFVTAQSKFPAVKKDQTGKVEGEGKRGNAYSYEYSYADLAGILQAIQPMLTENGLAIMQPIAWNGSPWLITRLVHSSGEWMECRYRLGEHDRPQDMGSEITYARRYSLTSFLGIATEGDDDDGKRASDNGGGRRGKSNLPPCPTCKDSSGHPTNKGVIVSKYGSGFYCHTCRGQFEAEGVELEAPRAETRTAPAPAPAKTKAAATEGDERRVRMPAAGSKSYEQYQELGAEVLRLVGGDMKAAGDLFAQIAGVRTCRGMKPDAVRGAWLSLADHPVYGVQR